MNPEQWQRINQLFRDARELATEERAAFLETACAGDEALRGKLLAMLAAAQEDDHQFSAPVWEKAAKAIPITPSMPIGPIGEDAEAAKMQLATGQRLGHYEVLNHLGSGGMGEVWLAWHPRLKRRAVLKLLPARFATDADRIRRFELEALATSALNHPNILTVYDIGDYDGAPYIVAEWLEGADLRALLPPQAELLPVRIALDYARQIAAGLAAAHEKGVVHRDLKPENLFVMGDGRVKILDFGLAKLKPLKFAGAAASQDTQQRLTDSGVIMGTVGYMSPEQVRGEEVDQRSDLFSFGSILYEMLAGHQAFQRGSMAETIAAILKEEPPQVTELSASNKQISPQLERVVRHCLEKKLELRFQSARDLCFALDALSAPPSAGPESAPLPQLESATLLTVTENAGRTRLFGNARLAWLAAALAVMTALAAVWLLRARAETRVTYTYLPLPEKTVSFDISGAAFSPDGRRVVMVAVTEGVNRLWLYSFDRTVPELLPGTEGAQCPFWSPNGASIGFFAQSQLKKIATSGSSLPAKLCDVPLGAGGAWSSTGVILFAPQFNGDGLWQVSESGGTATPFTKLDLAHFETGHNYPNFLPDGRHFIFFTQAGQPEYRGIRLGSLDNKQTSFLVRADTKAEYSSAGYLLLMRGRKILAQPFDPEKLLLSGDPVPVTEQVYYEAPFRYADLTVFADRMLIYRRGGNQTSQLTWFDRSGKQLTTIDPAGDYRSMQLSPDGGQVLLDRNDPEVETSDIWQFDLLRGTQTRLTSNPGTDTYPIWSPDGSQVAFASNREGVWGIYRVSGNGKEEPLLKGDQQLLLTSDWSSDGKFIVYRQAHEKTGLDIELLPLFGDHQPRNYLATPFYESYGVVSPDGHWLAYQSNDSGHYEIYVQSFPVPGRKMPVSKGDGMLPRWRRDGKELYYVATDDRLMAVPVKTGANFSAGTPIPLFDVGSLGRRLNRYVYDVSADGQRVLLIRQLEDASLRPLTLVQNWTEMLKK